eukprot:TRINITY_DN9361_c0_g1_i4.p1 TRINITY_DN9361_c0_g1~~TRINITY_DN9361_c0_g1_i4.p1  ORF type:complete len:393 (-),score=141.85 TRINITY_DN9361_c0_g1_i4:173-1351(-)
MVASPLRRRHTIAWAAADEVPFASAEDDNDDDEERLHELSLVVEAALRQREDLPGAAHQRELLRRTWRLAQEQGKQRQRLQQQLREAAEQARLQSERAARAEAARVAAEASEVGRGEEAEEAQLLLATSREHLKQRDADLEEARQRLQQLEAQSLVNAQHLVQVQERLRRSEEERRAAQKAMMQMPSEATSSDGAGESVAKMAQVQELSCRLEEAQAALQATREDLASADLRCQEAEAWGQQRARHLQAELEESRRLAAEHRTQLHAKLAALESSEHSLKQRPSDSGKTRRASMPCLAVLSEELGEAAAASADDAAGPKAPMTGNVKFSASDGSAKNGCNTTSCRGSTRGTAGSLRSSHGKRSGAVRPAAMPLDMRSLGRLLAGGGLLGGGV